MPRHQRFKWAEWARWALGQAHGLPVAVDTETTGVGYFDEPFCATLTWRDPDLGLQSAYISLEGPEREAHIALLRSILEHSPAWIMHNAKFDLQKLDLIGALPDDLHRVDDTMVVYSLIDENDRKGLKYLAAKFLGASTNEEKVLAAVRRKLKLKKSDGYYHIPREFIVPYALKDTEFTLELFDKLRPKLPEDLEPVYEAEIDLTLALLEIEGRGFALDIPYLEEAASEYGAKVMRGWQRIVKLTGNPDLNPNSPAQILEAFAARGVKLEATDKATLAQLDDELAEALLQFRTDSKLHKTYLLPMLEEQRDGIIHPNFNPSGARTGRMSSGAASNN